MKTYVTRSKKRRNSDWDEDDANKKKYRYNLETTIDVSIDV